MSTAFSMAPLFRSSVGFDRFNDLFETALRNEPGSTYPPYNVEKHGDDQYRIVVAAAGFQEEDLELQVEKGVLTISGGKRDANEGVTLSVPRHRTACLQTVLPSGGPYRNQGRRPEQRFVEHRPVAGDSGRGESQTHPDQRDAKTSSAALRQSNEKGATGALFCARSSRTTVRSSCRAARGCVRLRSSRGFRRRGVSVRTRMQVLRLLRSRTQPRALGAGLLRIQNQLQ